MSHQEQYRKAINFDLIQAQLDKHYPKSRAQAYEDIKKFFYKNDFLWRQGSGYLSVVPLSNADIIDLADRLHTAIPWFKDCVREIDVTNITGDIHSMKALIEAAAEQDSEVSAAQPKDEKRLAEGPRV